MGLGKVACGQVELDIDAYSDFLLSEKARFPVGRRLHQVSALPLFFQNAEYQLELLLGQAPPPTKSKFVSSSEEIFNEYVLIGHGKTFLNRGKMITGWSSDLLCKDWKEGNETITGGINQALKHADKINLEDYYLRFVSDLPRALHHALLMSKDEKIRSSISEKVGELSSLEDPEMYKDILLMAVRQGFIPTPLLRAQYYGPLEHGPETLNEGAEKKAFVERIYNDMINRGLRVRPDEVEESADSLVHRKELLFSPRRQGENQTETRPDLVTRITRFFRVVNDASKGKTVLVITSSSCFDASKTYFRNFGQTGKLTIENEPKVRGSRLVVKLGMFNGNNCYLNDPALLNEIRKDSGEVASRQRRASLDEGIRTPKKDQKDAIFPVELLGFEKESLGKYKSYKVSLADVLKSDEPTLFLGNFGQGKSTAAIELIDKINLTDKTDSSDKRVAVFLTARDINDGLHNKIENLPQKESDFIILELLSKGVPSLPISLRRECKPVFVIDALDEIHNYRENVLHVARDKLKEYGKVIVTSRFTGFNEYENQGFVTLQLDPQSVIRNMVAYLLSRITDSSGKTDLPRFEAFKEFLMKQDDAVKTNYLLVHFLTDLYNHRPDELGNLDKNLTEGEILIKGIQVALWDHKLSKKPDMPHKPRPYEGQPKEDAESRLKDYDTKRSECLSHWMDFLQRTAAYMHVHNTSTIDRKGLEEVKGGWTIEKYLSKLKVK